VQGKPGRVVLAIRVAESPEAPHEVRLGPSPEIPVRRRDNTESAGIDDVERLLRRRDALRDPAAREADIDFFEGRVATRDDERPPIVAVWMRPRLATGSTAAVRSRRTCSATCKPRRTRSRRQ
jgi:hypothetical protein